MVSIGDRLREERDALGCSQEELAAVTGITKKTQGLYERNERSPSAKYLADLSARGVDVLYVVTGVRAAQAAGLDEHESQLLEAFRNMSKQQQDAVLLLSSSLSSSSGKPPLADKP